MHAEGAEHATNSPDLMAHIRALYEDSAVPVHAIAAMAGVSERTIYKYAQKQRWKPRYAWMPDGARPVGRPARQRWTGYAPVKGAGGRFMARADRDKPFAAGLKALDPAGRAAALAHCAAAEPLARQAQREAAAERRQEARLRALADLNRATRALADYRRDRDRQRAAKQAAQQWGGDPWRRPTLPPPVPDNARLERTLELAVATATRLCDVLYRDEEPASVSTRRP